MFWFKNAATNRASERKNATTKKKTEHFFGYMLFTWRDWHSGPNPPLHRGVPAKSTQNVGCGFTQDSSNLRVFFFLGISELNFVG